MFNVRNLFVRRVEKDVLRDVSFAIAPGELVVLTGANGVGKSTLALTLLGHPSCQVVSGAVELDGVNLLPLKTHERARTGLFLGHQEPPALAGVSVTDALRAASDATRQTPYSTAEFFDALRTASARLQLPQDFPQRNLHEAFSGGEKKRLELLSLMVLQPKYAVLDEIDSGMDTMARDLAAAVIVDLRKVGVGFLLISHNESFIETLSPTKRLAL